MHFVDLVKSIPTSIWYLLAKIGFDTAENEPVKNWQILQKLHGWLRVSSNLPAELAELAVQLAAREVAARQRTEVAEPRQVAARLVARAEPRGLRL